MTTNRIRDVGFVKNLEQLQQIRSHEELFGRSTSGLSSSVLRVRHSKDPQGKVLNIRRSDNVIVDGIIRTDLLLRLLENGEQRGKVASRSGILCSGGDPDLGRMVQG